MFKPLHTTILTSLLISLGVQGVFHWFNKQPTIARVDIAAITEEFIQQEAQKNHSNKEKQQVIKAFSSRLEGALEQLSYKKSLILLPKEAVIKGSVDYTETLRIMVSEGHS